MKRTIAPVLSGVFIALALGSWAVSYGEAAHFPVQWGGAKSGVSAQRGTPVQVPRTVRFQHDKGRGLLVQAWLNDRGPYRFAVDTGAGIMVLSQAVASNAGITTRGRTTTVAGFSGRQVEALTGTIDRIAIGTANNRMPSRLRAIILPNLPSDIDGILDPTEAYSPLGYTIDFPAQVLSAFDPKLNGLSEQRQPRDGAVVRWQNDAQSKRPFVRLSDGRLALIDTGSQLGLAFSPPPDATVDYNRGGVVRDVGGGSIRTTRVAPSTVSVGALELRGVPTDLLTGTAREAPAILGRAALYPFRISFDPLRRLIEIAPSMQDGS